MKKLFETADLEAEIFSGEEKPEELVQEREYDLEQEAEDGFAGLENLSEDAMEGFPALELTLELTDGRVLEYEVAAVFVHEGKEYIGLHPKSDTEGLIHVMQLIQGENDEIELLPIKEEKELNAVYETFFELYAEDDGAEQSVETDMDEENPGTNFRARRFNVR